MKEKLRIKSVLVRGIFHFSGNRESKFKGPVKKGFSPIVWYTKVNGHATSCSFISDVEINEGESKIVDIVILNELQLQHKIEKEMILNIGSTVHKIGEFKIIEYLGEWHDVKQ